MGLSLFQVAPFIGEGTEGALKRLPAGTYLFVASRSTPHLYVIDPADPDSDTFPYGVRGPLPNSINEVLSMVSFRGALIVFGRKSGGGRYYWRIDPQNPSSTDVPYQELGALPSKLGSPEGAANHNNTLYVADRSGDELWRLSPSSSTSLTGSFSKVGDFPEDSPGQQDGMSAPNAATSHNNKLLVADGGEGSLWNINPNNPSSKAGAYGRVGFLVSDLAGETALADFDNKLFMGTYAGDKLWRVDPNSPGSSTSPYGEIGAMPSGMGYGPYGMTSHTIV